VRMLEDDLSVYRDAATSCRQMFSLDTMIDGYERSLQAAMNTKDQASI